MVLFNRLTFPEFFFLQYVLLQAVLDAFAIALFIRYIIFLSLAYAVNSAQPLSGRIGSGV